MQFHEKIDFDLFNFTIFFCLDFFNFLACSIQNINVIFQERNSATLLFSALCTRIFGVKRSKNELSKRNSMSARMFFHRFPNMYDFLLNELKSVAKIIISGAMCPEESALYPILILVAKLQPSIFTSNEDFSERKYQVSKFFFHRF